MSTDSTKQFASIREDYTFFETHATEAKGDLEGYARLLAGLDRTQLLEVLDFGCGPGSFSERFLTQLAVPPDRLRLALIEPDAVYRQKATATLARFTQQPIRAWASYPIKEVLEPNLVVSNHVLYYVPDLHATLPLIALSMQPKAMFLASIANRDNALVKFWIQAFAMLNKPLPYHTAEDVEQALSDEKLPYEKHRVEYELSFEDSEENRLKILRFLLTEHLTALPRDAVLAWYAPYVVAGRIEIRTSNEQFVIRSKFRS